MEYKLPPLPKNLPNVVRRIRACEGEVAAQVVFEHALNEYAIAAIEAHGVPDGWREFVQRVAGQKPEKPDYWSACGQCERNISDAEDLLAFAQPAPQALTTCNCRWDVETQVQQCTLHEAHVDAIHEWAERAKTAEAKLLAPQASVVQQEPVAWVDPGDFDLMQSQGRGVIAWPKQYPNATMPLYTHPAQQAKPQPLSDEQIERCRQAGYSHGGLRSEFSFEKAARAIEAAHGIQGS